MRQHPGTVTAIGLAPGSTSSQRSSGSASQWLSTVLTVTPDDPSATGTGSGIDVQVSLTIQSVRHVLAAPVSALLALAGGGYGVEIVPASGPRRLVGVTDGSLCRRSRSRSTGAGDRGGDQSGRGAVMALELEDVTKVHAGTTPVVALRSLSLRHRPG